MSTQARPTDLEYPDDPPTYDYPWIAAYGRYCGLQEKYIQALIADARSQGAPISATHRWSPRDADWHTLDEVRDPEARWWLMDYAARFDLIVPRQVLQHWLDPDYRVEPGYNF